jgi:hypothetical protein
MSFFPSDPESEVTLISLLEEMLTQLKISNAHLEIVSDTEITEEDMESE